ncbi:hypothetical protein [Bathymodiolus japonicus methanotrophic gill symbiont]|uniref:hypothetical protein n=1 Tax=Bathymodiolus japonicus methanotrophic gill symbiont TaxID=113269 RepID=UPI001C8D382C|nr:hypothetical protein [Bathymodiolus japonicus methanotrophic gill symbiont]
MGRIFSFIAIAVILITTLTGAGVFYLAQAHDDQIKATALNGLVKGIAQSISTRTQLLSETLRNIAQSPEIVNTLNRSDLPRAKVQVQQMSAYLPDAMAFRLLLPSDNKPDNSITPHMGYADLDLVKNTFQKPQHPLIQGEQGENSHLAITHGIEQDGQVITVILASVDFQDLQQNFKILTDEQTYIELKQANVVLFSHGKAALKSSARHHEFKVKNTAWTISYWYQDSLDLTLAYTVPGIIFFAAIISALTCYLGYRKLRSLLITDQHSILQATKDLLLGHANGNYPVKLKVMGSFISSIIQFKRENDIAGTNTPKAFEIHTQETDTPFLDTQLVGIEVKDVQGEEA